MRLHRPPSLPRPRRPRVFDPGRAGPGLLHVSLLNIMTPTHIRRCIFSARHHKLSLNGLALLCLLHERSAVSMTTAAQELDISTAALTGLADTLCHLSYAQREQTTGDRRGIQLHITTRGHSACDTITQGLPRTQKDLPTKTLGLRYAR